jgi:hypothetical protein
VDAVVDPSARSHDPLARGNRSSMTHHRHDITMSARPGARDAETILGVVVGYSLDEAGQHFPGVRLRIRKFTRREMPWIGCKTPTVLQNISSRDTAKVLRMTRAGAAWFAIGSGQAPPARPALCDAAYTIWQADRQLSARSGSLGARPRKRKSDPKE